MKTTPRRRITAILIACAICFAPMSSFAQSNDEPDWLDEQLSLSTTSTSYAFLPVTLIALAGAIITGGGGVTTTTTLMKDLEQEKKKNEQFAAMLDGYMSEHPEVWRDTVSLGGGLMSDDLSGVLALRPEDRGAFGVALRQQRQPMIALLDAPRGMARGHQAIDLLLNARAAISAQ